MKKLPKEETTLTEFACTRDHFMWGLISLQILDSNLLPKYLTNLGIIEMEQLVHPTTLDQNRVDTNLVLVKRTTQYLT